MYHKISIVGNVGRDPEMRFTPSGQAICNFSIAANRNYKSASGESVKETVWFRVSVWGKLAEVCNQYVKKGSLVLVEGRLTPDKATGNPRIWTTTAGDPATSYEVNAETVRFLSKQEGKSHEEAESAPEEDVPF